LLINLREMCSVSRLEDPLVLEGRKERGGGDHPLGVVHSSKIACAQVHLRALFNDDSAFEAVQEGGQAARVAIADYVARELTASSSMEHDGLVFETLDAKTHTTSSRIRKRKKGTSLPFMLERTDVFCDADHNLHVYLRILAYQQSADDDMKEATKATLNRILQTGTLVADAMNHVATAVLQERLRSRLSELNALAFVADGAILPRKSGASAAPMASPPAVPFLAPPDSPMDQNVEVEMGTLRSFLKNLPSFRLVNGHMQGPTAVCLSGLLIPQGVSLIVGGGYHGKSTMLRCIAAGCFNKAPGDGREFCVTINDAVNIRAEDGRYVNNCNVSGFISNLPTPPGVTKAPDTTHFSSGEASGSTSQAANVIEAIEMGARAFLVDEDVSAANFMARDGRMRAMVMDESITPLLYRVNGLYASKGISSIVVVGGVGDWLDVPDSVILMEKYVCKDATKKARSVSKQFSHGHVQYAGRGVVHRLPWDKSGTPMARRPADAFSSLFDRESTTVSILQGSDTLLLHHAHDMADDDDDDDEDCYIDLSRCEQMVGKKPQLYGCGVCTLWLLEEARKHPRLGFSDLLNMLDKKLDESGMVSLLLSDGKIDSTAWKLLVETMGFASRPRKYAVGQALARLRGIVLEEVPVMDDGSDAAAAAEAERKKAELMEIWNARRKNKLNDR
jgi:predicted ABC-class ATPase